MSPTQRPGEDGDANCRARAGQWQLTYASGGRDWDPGEARRIWQVSIYQLENPAIPGRKAWIYSLLPDPALGKHQFNYSTHHLRHTCGLNTMLTTAEFHHSWILYLWLCPVALSRSIHKHTQGDKKLELPNAHIPNRGWTRQRSPFLSQISHCKTVNK